MRFLSLNQVMMERGDFEAKVSGWRLAVMGVIFIGMILVPGLIFIFDRDSRQLGFESIGFVIVSIVSIIFFLLGLLILKQFRASRSPENWVIRTRGFRIYIKYRSFANRHFATDEPQVIELDKDEIKWIRESKITRICNNRDGMLTSVGKYLDLSINSRQTVQIRDHLHAEQNHAPVGSTRMRSKSRDLPVEWVDDQILRISWTTPTSVLTPSIATALSYFQSWTKIAEPYNNKLDYTVTVLRDLPELEQMEKLRELHRTNPFEAVHTAKRLLKISLTEAHQLFKPDNENQ